MKGYRVQDGCHNCVHVFRRIEYDEGERLFCNLGKDRPKCGSVAMDESFNFRDVPGDAPDEVWERSIGTIEERTWAEWTKGHAVNGAGICDDWQAQKATNQ